MREVAVCRRLWHRRGRRLVGRRRRRLRLLNVRGAFTAGANVIGRRMAAVVTSRRACWRAVVDIEIVVPRLVAWLLGPLQFVAEFTDYAVLNHFPASAVYGMRNIGIQLCPAIVVQRGSIDVQAHAAFVAMVGAQVSC